MVGQQVQQGVYPAQIRRSSRTREPPSVGSASAQSLGRRRTPTIGLAHTHGGPELAMFGLDVHAMHRMLNTLGEKSAAGEALADGQSHSDVVVGHRVALRQVDRGWYRTFFGQAIGFYRRPPLPMLQVAWPGAEGRFHWDKQAGERHRESQPQLWLPRVAILSGSGRSNSDLLAGKQRADTGRCTTEAR
ncbi:DUF4262 domain-containing protein [Streptomyces sp. NPDC086787]|uniref:DUF4262 domain-containing protein n=1 Tax=Streptomyces sp. NPDC086787 TaxID=3365759 RepID=UPI0038035998